MSKIVAAGLLTVIPFRIHSIDAVGAQIAEAGKASGNFSLQPQDQELVFMGERCRDDGALRDYGVCEPWIVQVGRSEICAAATARSQHHYDLCISLIHMYTDAWRELGVHALLIHRQVGWTVSHDGRRSPAALVGLSCGDTSAIKQRWFEQNLCALRR